LQYSPTVPLPLPVALLLGLVQGLTEFLPISSSAHLVLAQELLDYTPPGLLLEAVVHLATTLVIIIYFHRRFIAILRGLRHDAATWRLVGMLALAFATTAVLGLILEKLVAADFETPAFVGVELLVTGAALASIHHIKPTPEAIPLYGITWKVALIVGLAQGLSVIPGLSRSGLTIVAGLWSGLGRGAAAEFSFLLAAPTILAASLYELWREPDLSSTGSGALLLAAIVSFVSGFLAIHWLMLWVSRGRMIWFAAYCGVVGVAALLFFGLDLF
jgi:undecaprenyl-diphosphatase